MDKGSDEELLKADTEEEEISFYKEDCMEDYIYYKEDPADDQVDIFAKRQPR